MKNIIATLLINQKQKQNKIKIIPTKVKDVLTCSDQSKG